MTAVNKKNDFVKDAVIATSAAVVGAAVGAAAVAMADPAIKKKVVAGVHDLQEKVGDARDAVMDKVEEAQK